MRYKRALAVLLACLLCVAGCTAVAESSDELICGDYSYTLNEDGTATITHYNGSAARVVIPAELDGHPVTVIGRESFGCNYPREKANKTITSVVIPEGVIRIGRSAFDQCVSLSEVSLPEGLIEIENLAFQGCSSLKSIQFPSTLLALSGNCFNTAGLTSVTLPASLQLMYINPFSNCTGLESIGVEETNPIFYTEDGVLFDRQLHRLIAYPAGKRGAEYTVPEGTEIIEQFAFERCQLQRVTIAESVHTLGLCAFHWSPSLREVVLTGGMRRIESQAFNGCMALETIVLPEGLESMGAAVFDYCTGLTELNLPASLQDIEEDELWEDPLMGEASDVHLTVIAGSWAEEWCKAQGRDYTALPSE